MIFHDSTLWVFFDEINTCNSMGLISEILCKRKMKFRKTLHLLQLVTLIELMALKKKKEKNEKIRDGLKVANAQNEIRNNLKDKKEIDKIKNLNKKSSLVYAVNPLPHSLLNFVFDFGRVSDEDEKNILLI